MAHRPVSSLSVAVLGVLMVAASGAHIRAVSAQDLEHHMALSIELLELSVAEWQERVALPASESAEARAAALAAIEKKFKAERVRLYDNYSTNATAHLRFFATNAAEVDQYLEEYSEVKTRIDSLTQTLRNLVAQAESPGGPPGASQ